MKAENRDFVAVRAYPKRTPEPVTTRLIHRLPWRCVRDRLSRLRRLFFPQPRTYRAWVRSYDRLNRRDARKIRAHIREMARRPLMSLVMPVTGGDERLIRPAISRIARQLYPGWELCIGAAAEAVPAVEKAVARRHLADRIKVVAVDRGARFADLANAALGTASGEFIALLGVADELAPHALYMLAVELDRCPDAVILYADEDVLDERRQRHNPRFKTDWNPDLLLGHDMIGRLAAYRRSVVKRIGGLRREFAGAEEYDLVLRASEQTASERIRHIPMILYHRRTSAKNDASQSLCRASSEHLGRRGIAAAVTPISAHYARIRYPVPEPDPGVSVIVPTRDRVDLLSRCVEGLLTRTDYQALEVLIVENDSEEAATLAYLSRLAAEPRVRVLRFPGPFNFSAMNNFAVAQIGNPLIALLNNDIEIIHSDWLREMVSHAVRPEVGAVGAKLYYPDDTIQHAGTIIGVAGAAGHAFRHFRRGDPGYDGRLVMTQNLSAVTAACMLLRREVFEEVGGLDAANLAIAYNDVDFCLRLRERGYRIVWTPFSELYHWESVSRGSDLAPGGIERFRREQTYLVGRWRAVMAHDPYYNPNLTIQREDFSLAFPPRVSRPWHDRKRPDSAVGKMAVRALSQAAHFYSL